MIKSTHINVDYSTTTGYDGTLPDGLTWDDIAWILTSSFIIFTMQTGFGLLESGAITKKNEVNILIKNLVDVVFGGITYWMYGYGLQYGSDAGANAFCGWGSFFVEPGYGPDSGEICAEFIFQLSFATTATTIVSGAMAERTNFNAYCIFSLLNTLTYCIPAGWVWGDHGYLRKLGMIDFAGSGAVHLLGACAAFVAAVMLQPRLNRYSKDTEISMGNPVNAITGTFILWWGWLGFNCGSTYGSSFNKWHYAGRSGITTINGSIGGGLAGMIYSYVKKNKKFEVGIVLNSILGGLVSITAGCAFFQPVEALMIGFVGGLLTSSGSPILDRFHIDDPVGAFGVHGFGGAWALIAVGLFADADSLLELNTNAGLFKGGGFYLLGIQLLGIVAIASWSFTTTWFFLTIIDHFVPIRMQPQQEILGADFIEHNIRHSEYDYDSMLQSLEQLGMHVHEKWCHVPAAKHLEEEEYVRNHTMASVSLVDVKLRRFSEMTHVD
ncbi:amt-3 (predicted) [Pycnogonum litorale]